MPLKKLKHAGFLTRKYVPRYWARLMDHTVTPVINAATGPAWKPEVTAMADGQFPMDAFVHRSAPMADWSRHDVPRRAFVLWTGANEMPPARMEALKQIHGMLEGVAELVLVTPETIGNWVVEGSAIHPAYEHLSLVHRSDYLRCYLMHHHGGGYIDLKPPTGSWADAFDLAETDEGAWVIGYPEIMSRHATYMESPMGRLLRRRYRSLAGNGSFIVRPYTPFTSMWFEEVEARMNYFQAALARNPAVDPFGFGGGYPVPWSALLGQVFQPAQLPYLEHVRLDPQLRPVMGGDRTI